MSGDLKITLCVCGNATFVTMEEPYHNGFGSSIRYQTRCPKCGRLIHVGYDETSANGCNLSRDD